MRPSGMAASCRASLPVSLIVLRLIGVASVPGPIPTTRILRLASFETAVSIACRLWRGRPLHRRIDELLEVGTHAHGSGDANGQATHALGVVASAALPVVALAVARRKGRFMGRCRTAIAVQRGCVQMHFP